MATKPLQSVTFPNLPNQYTVPVVDSTLSKAGAAADAKKTGDEITDLKADLNHLGLSVVDGAINVSFIVNE